MSSPELPSDASDAEFTEFPNLGDELSTVSKDKQGGSFWVGLSGLLLALAALGWQGWNHYTADQSRSQEDSPALQELRQQVEELRSDMESQPELQGEFDRHLQPLADQLETLQGERVQWHEEQRRLKSNIGTLQDGLAAAIDLKRGTSSSAIVMEVETLLRIANQRLRLFADPRSAIRALSLADQQLKTLDEPRFDTVRQEISADLSTLKFAAGIDLAALTGQLAALSTGVSEWPLGVHNEEPVETTSEPPPERWWQRGSAAFSEVITIRKESEIDLLRLDPALDAALRARVELGLGMASAALSRLDFPLFQQFLAEVTALQRQFFDLEDPTVAAAVDLLAHLSASLVNPEYPDLGRLVNQFQAARRLDTSLEPEA